MCRTGRFAPSPTGELHFGSLIAALASYLQAKSRGGQWLVRIEDIDPPREVPGSAGRILEALQRFGLKSDQPVLYQSKRTDAYDHAIGLLLDSNQAYWCGCSRSELPSSGVYPGTCSRGLPAGKSPRSVRLRVRDEDIGFTDLIQGSMRENLSQTVGDFVIRRADGLAAYQLAVVVDDAFQGVTEVVRGADLLDSTARQIHLQNCLGFTTPEFAHHPVAVGQDGQKLSKRLGSDPVVAFSPERTLELALEFLGQPCPPGMDRTGLLNWALENWQLSKIPRSAFTL
ncbi:tRNA glutamyl-Q(34) synthetase GluQRS [Pseudomonadota bacterium]